MKENREIALKQRAKTIWFTGLPSSGKTTIGEIVNFKLGVHGFVTYMIDGDVLRTGLCKGLKFSEADRAENLRRAAEVCKMFNDAGLIVVAAFVSPLEKDREIVRQILGKDLIEIYVKASVETCISRDPKGNYAKALKGEILDFTGVGSPYEVPKEPDFVADTETGTAQDIASGIVKFLRTSLSVA